MRANDSNSAIDARRVKWGHLRASKPAGVDVVGVGEISLDRRIAVSDLPRPGEKQTSRGDETLPGGQVATALLGCARLGLRTAFLGAVGDDPSAQSALAPLVAGGVDVANVQVVLGGSTRQAWVLVEVGNGERSVIEKRDEAVFIDTSRLDRSLVQTARALLIDVTDPDAALWAARAAREAGVAVFLDADSPSPAAEMLLPWVDFPVVSQQFAEGIGRGVSSLAGLRSMLEAGAVTAVVTLGERGALAVDAEGKFESAAFEILPADTTGAGDAFHAGWIAAALAGEDLESGLRMANATAALNCGAQGAQGGLPTPDELTSFLRSQRQRPWRGA